MASLHIRGVDDEVVLGLKARARRHGRSLQKEVEIVLADAARMAPSATAAGTSPLAGLTFAATGRKAATWSRNSLYGDDGR